MCLEGRIEWALLVRIFDLGTFKADKENGIIAADFRFLIILMLVQ